MSVMSRYAVCVCLYFVFDCLCYFFLYFIYLRGEETLYIYNVRKEFAAAVGINRTLLTRSNVPFIS